MNNITSSTPLSDYLQNEQQEAKYHGHRQRLKQKFSLSSKGILDYEILELLLFYIFPRKDTKPIAKKLLQKFGSLKSVLFANNNAIKNIEGCGESSVFFINLLKEIFCRISLESVKSEQIISSNLHVIEYYQNILSQEKKEQFRVMFINNKNKLIAEEELQHGTIDQTAIYPREVIQKTLEYGASAIILVHNHPSGDFQPSQDDIIITNKLKEIANQLDIKLLDHIIIGKKGCFSFANHKLI